MLKSFKYLIFTQNKKISEVKDARAVERCDSQKDGRLELADCGANQGNETDEASPESSTGTYQLDYLV